MEVEKKLLSLEEHIKSLEDRIAVLEKYRQNSIEASWAFTKALEDIDKKYPKPK